MKRGHEGDAKAAPIAADQNDEGGELPVGTNQKPKEEDEEIEVKEDAVTIATIHDLMARCQAAQQLSGGSQPTTENDNEEEDLEEEEEEELFVEYPGQTAADVMADMNDLMAKCQLVEKTARDNLLVDNNNDSETCSSSSSNLVDTTPSKNPL